MTKLSLLRLAFVPLSMATLTALAQNDPTALRRQPAPMTFPDASRPIAQKLQQALQQKQAPRKAVQSPLRGSDTPIEPDWQTSFDLTADVNLFTVYDLNQDGITWEWNDAYDGSMRSNYSRNNGNDDWLVTPPVHFLPGRQYIIKFNIRNAADSWLNTFEVKYGEGDTPDTFDKTLQSTYEPDGTDFETKTYYITVDKEVTYRFGFHDNTAEADHYWLFFDDLSIEKGPLSTSPAAVEGLAVTPAPQGALRATIDFTAPTKTVGGGQLDKIDGFVVKRDGNEIARLQGTQPGQKVSYSDEAVPSNGFHTYQVTALLGTEEGSKEQKSAYIGLDSPSDPTQVKLLDGGNNVMAQWPEARRYGQNQGYVDPSQVSVSLFEMVETTYGVSVGELVQTSDPGAQEMILDVDPDESTNLDGKTQSLYQLAARADNPAGSSGYYGTHPVVVGPSIKLPFKESLSYGHLENGFVWTAGNDVHNSRMNAAGWMLVNDNPADGDAGSLRWRPYTVSGMYGDTEYNIIAGDMVSMNMPKVALDGAEHPKLFFSLYSKVAEDAHLNVVVETPDAEEYLLHSYDLSTTLQEGWSRKELDLSQWAGEKHIVVKFQGVCDANPEEVYIGVDDINIFDQKDNNLAAVALTTPKSVEGGRTATVQATVKNFGATKATGYKVQLLCNDKVVDTVERTQQLGILESDTVDLKFAAGVNLGERATLKAQVVYAGDEIAADNTSEPVAVRIRRPGYSTVTDLQAVAPSDDGVVNLAWGEPAKAQPERVTEDFEDYEPFATDLGNWTLIDGDKGLAGGFFSSYSYPGQNKPMAFMAFNPDAITDAFAVVASNPGLTPKSGDQFAGAPYASDAAGNLIAADNWLISPELSGNAQSVDFYAFNVTIIDEWGNVTPYNETFDILYSTTGTAREDFTVIRTDKADGTSAISEGANWKPVHVELPAGAKYMAIHHKSDAWNSFLFGIDDVTFEKGAVGANDVITHYNIYRDSELVGQTTDAATSYSDHGVATGDHIYNVTAVYRNANGEEHESAFSNDAALYVNGIAEIISTSDTTSAPRYNLQGQRVGQNYRGVVVEEGRKLIVK